MSLFLSLSDLVWPQHAPTTASHPPLPSRLLFNWVPAVWEPGHFLLQQAGSLSKSSTNQTAQCLWRARSELFSRTRGLLTENFLSDPQLVGEEAGQLLASASTNPQELFTPPGWAQVLALLLWVFWVENKGWAQESCCCLDTGSGVSPGLSFPSPRASASPLVIETFVFLREGNSSTWKKKQWMFRILKSGLVPMVAMRPSPRRQH